MQGAVTCSGCARNIFMGRLRGRLRFQVYGLYILHNQSSGFKGLLDRPGGGGRIRLSVPKATPAVL